MTNDNADRPDANRRRTFLKTTVSIAGVDNGQQIADLVPTRRAFGGPPGLPDDRMEILRDAFAATLTENEEMQAAAEEAERPITYEDGETTAEAITSYVDGWSDRQEILEQIQDA